MDVVHMHHEPLAGSDKAGRPGRQTLRRPWLAHWVAWVGVWAGLLLWLCCGRMAQAAEPPAQPQLRIEAGMHTAVINRIATDAQGRWAVTASDDKTARVWDVASGRLLQVLRPPIGPGHEGKLYAVALSPDGAVVAVAGCTGFDWYGAHHIYLMDRASGRLLRRLGGLPEVIEHLAFSPDGRYLAAALGGGHGVRVWQWHTAAKPAAGTGFNDQSYGASFSRDGRLVVSSYDGQLRLYRVTGTDQPRLEPLASVQAPGGKRPYSVAFHPDGSRIAVGYSDSTRVDVLDGRTLAPMYTPSVAGANNGDLGTVAWSADGQTLSAAGRWKMNGRYPVRRWPDGGRGAPMDVQTNLADTIMDMAPLPEGGWLVAGFGPAWGRVTAQGQWQRMGAPPAADLRDSRGDAFLLAAGGAQLQFGYEAWGKPPHVFDLRSRRLSTGTLPGGQAPEVKGLDIQGWVNTTAPTLRGQPLNLEAYEMSRSLAIAPGADRFVLGAEYRLRLFSADGTLRWALPVPGIVWGVNIPSTGPRAGQLVVAAYGDGTIRWHRLSDGQELLAFFPHADRQRWVLWTPQGYYDASPGGEDLIGWHVNRGVDAAADFFPAGRFRERFYRPDVIDRVLDTLDEAQAVAQADAARGTRPTAPATPAALVQALPPVVDVLSGTEVQASSPQLTIRVRGRSAADAPVTAWRVRVNGELVPDVRGLARTDASDVRELAVPLPPRDSEVQVFAENRHGVSSAAVVRVAWKGAAPAPAVARPRLYVLAIGVGQYQNTQVNRLGELPGKDARDFVAAIRRQQGRLYERVEVKLLTDAEATRDNVVDALEWLQRQPRQFDVSMLFVSGHGFMDPAMGYLFLPVNANPEAMKRTTVNWADFKSTIGAMAGKRVVFMDTCHAGNALGAQYKAPYNDITGVIADLISAENGVVVFASSTGRQLSIQDPAWGNGAFTKAVVEGLNGRATPNDRGEVTHKRLSVYVSDRVHSLTGGRQTPVNPDPVGVPDFPLALSTP